MSAVFDRLVARCTGALGAVGRPDDQADAVAAVAAVVLGTIAEPGDGVLGRLAAVLGVDETAAFVLERPAPGSLVRAFRSADQQLDPRTARAALERWLPRIEPDVMVRAVVQAGRVGARLLLPADPLWPRGVDDLAPHAPFALWVRGTEDALVAGGRAIALVGARASTGYGDFVAGEAAAGLSDRGVTIVSGGAYGIDGAAHRAALTRGGTTVALLAGGVDRFYPAGHDRLLTEITKAGAVVSELPCGAAPTRWRFLQRNRLIAATTGATVVVEAGVRSGSLNTAAHAATLGRPVGAVPGPVTSPSSAGCHRLLREYDAICVTGAAQMAELVDGTGPDEPNTAPSRDTSDMVRVLDALSLRSPRTVDDLARRAGLPPAHVMAALGALDATARATRRPDGWLAAHARNASSALQNPSRSGMV
jgi:DNA processing protein